MSIFFVYSLYRKYFCFKNNFITIVKGFNESYKCLSFVILTTVCTISIVFCACVLYKAHCFITSHKKFNILASKRTAKVVYPSFEPKFYSSFYEKPQKLRKIFFIGLEVFFCMIERKRLCFPLRPVGSLYFMEKQFWFTNIVKDEVAILRDIKRMGFRLI